MYRPRPHPRLAQSILVRHHGEKHGGKSVPSFFVFVQGQKDRSSARMSTTELWAMTSYRMVIFVLLIFATGMMIAALVFLVMLITMNRRMAQIEKSGIQVNSLLISRDEKKVYLNNMGFKLTDAAMETLSILAEARMDDDVLSGIELEAIISGKSQADCEEAAGATRIKRLRDSLGNQMVSELLVKNIARRGYMLGIDKSVIKVL